jgi:hypothetical protein
VDPAARKRSQNAASAEDLRLERSIVGDHGRDNSGVAGIGNRPGDSRAVCAQRFRAGLRAIKNSHAMSGTQKTFRHAGSHAAETNQTYVHSSLHTF